MRTLRVLLACSLVAVATASAQDWKGRGTLSGTVTDPAGKAIGGATVTLTFVSAKVGPPETKTNGKGEWRVKDLANGKWLVRVVKEKFEPKEAEVEVGGETKDPHISMRLAPVGSADAGAELAAAEKKGAELIAEKKYAEARALYEDLLKKYPKIADIHIRLSQTYDGEGQFAQAAAELRKFLEIYPQRVDIVGFYAVEHSKAGNADEALRVLTAIPPAQMKDSTDLQECGFHLLRAKKPVDAIKFFEVGIARFPDQATNYYYRGLSEWQIGAIAVTPGSPESRAHFDKATADLSKFLAMAPNAPEAANAKKILEYVK